MKEQKEVINIVQLPLLPAPEKVLLLPEYTETIYDEMQERSILDNPLIRKTCTKTFLNRLEIVVVACKFSGIRQNNF